MLRERLFRKTEARELLAISRPTLDRMIARGDLDVVRLGRRVVRIRESVVRKLIARGVER